ncbi:type 1 glutamine amidotransferase [Alkaliphilus sp. AH-315-G20]|nr:type 1 glutamine amidotransferase [Alkaliphilus sp. AH-315-G20]
MSSLIGITTYYVKAYEMGEKRVRGVKGQDMIMSTHDYSTSVEKTGSIPVYIPVINSDSYIDQIANTMDGIIFAGGEDIAPSKYGQANRKNLSTIVPQRDTFEFSLISKFIEKKKPILGICRGMQVINTFFGGTLHQDIYNAKLTEIEHVGIMAPQDSISHKVKLTRGSLTYKAFEKDTISVNSYHHQAIDEIGKDLVVTGHSEDNIIESIEHRKYPFLVGVQWHPEMMAETHKEQLKLFQLFIDTVKKAKQSNG